MLDRLPVLLLKELVLLPYQEIKLDLKVELSQEVVDLAEELYGNKLLIVLPKVGASTCVKIAATLNR